MKKIFAVFITLALIISTVAGCGSIAANTVFSKDDLAGKTIGVQLGTTGDEVATEFEKQDSTIERYNNGADAIQSLKQGKVDCVIIDNEPAKNFVAKNADLKILDDKFDAEEYAICLAKGNIELKDKINVAIATLKENGTLNNILNNYIGDDVGKTPYTSSADVVRSNGTLKMATNAAFPPYEYIENENIVGVDPDLAQAICDILGMELKIEDMEFDSIITSVKSGKSDVGIAGMSVTEDRLENAEFTDPYTVLLPKS